MDKTKNKNFVSAASRLSAIASSVMDLHVRIALQEVDREKRRLISGGIFIAIGAILLLMVLITLHIISYLFLNEFNTWEPQYNLSLIILIDLYYQLGEFLKQNCSGWTFWLLSGNPKLTKFLKMKASLKIPINNGGIDCRWIKYLIN